MAVPLPICCPARLNRGFTLVELLVAIAAMAMLAMLSWRGIDGMVRSLSVARDRTDGVQIIQTALAQWRTDLDALADAPSGSSLDWNGQTLRLTRRDGTDGGAGLRVVAWTRRTDDQSVWLRWQSGPLSTRAQWHTAWLQAAVWAQNPGDAERRQEVRLFPLQEWRIYYFRGDNWSNPLSASGVETTGAATPAVPEGPPDGVRLVLTLPDGQALAGPLTLDWVRPALVRSKS